ncbi:MAG: S8 family serine peptidase [Candidatus Competibacteraceae bacterium]|nr:S8 family serine peptidase [Candidatus Competibacteraceae bacterium]
MKLMTAINILLVSAMLAFSPLVYSRESDDSRSALLSSPKQGYILRGVIQPATGAAVDNDVNDPNAFYQSNDTVSSAQEITNPVTLSGYVNQPGSGPAGRSRGRGDTVDVYKVKLLAGQTVSLFIAGDGLHDDLDLGLYDLKGQLLDMSSGLDRVESLVVETSGDYLIAVAAAAGASNYTLTLGQSLAVASHDMRLSAAFMPGEAVVHFREGLATAAHGTWVRAQARGLTARSRQEPGERNRLLRLNDWRGIQSPSRPACALPAVLPDASASVDADVEARLETLCMVKSLSLDPDVASATLNYLRQPLFVPNDPLYRFQWHYPQINLPQAWDLTTGADTIVAVVDTGVALGHPDLQGQLITGYDFISNRANALDGDGIDPDPNDVGDRSNPDGSSSFHGTHVSGTVAAATNNQTGGAGVAFGAKIMPLRAIGRFGGSSYDIEQAVRYAAGLPNDSGTVPPRRADVINLSLGSTASSSADRAAYAQARTAGVVIVAAAGNSANSTPLYPASYPGVISVSAVTINKTLAPYSSFGPNIDVAAPGGSTATDVNGDGKPDGVLSTAANDVNDTLVYDYPIWQGTSMATPHAAGVIALMKALAPNLTPDDIDNLLASGSLTDDLGAVGRDNRFGYGLLNANKAAIAAANSGGQPVDPVPVLAVNPTALNFGIVSNQQSLTVFNAGLGDLTVNPPTEDSGGWLMIAPDEINANGMGSYQVSVNRDGLADGVYSATLTFTSNVNTAEIKVIMQVANNLSAGAIGQQYVVLVNIRTRQSVSTMARRQPDGSYVYTLRGIPAGTYQIFAGSDANNDFYICDAGESCGAYLTLDDPIALRVRRNRRNLNFVSGYTLNLADFQSASTSSRPGPVARRKGRDLITTD